MAAMWQRPLHSPCVLGPVACLSLMRHRNALTEKAWKDARTGTGKTIATFNSRYYGHQYNTEFFSWKSFRWKDYPNIPFAYTHINLKMLRFNFTLGLNFIFFCFKLLIVHYHTQKQKKIEFKPRMKLNHNIYTLTEMLIQEHNREVCCLYSLDFDWKAI